MAVYRHLWNGDGGRVDGRPKSLAWLVRYRLLALLAALMVAGCNTGLSPTEEPTDADAAAPTAAAELADVTPEPGSLNLLATILTMEDLSLFSSALVAAGLAPELEGEAAYTVLAPTNAAFEALPPGMLDALMADPTALAEVLRYHLIVGAIAGAELAPLGTAQTVQGETVAVALSQDANLVVNNAEVIEADIAAANGIIHKIDTLLLPTTAQALLLPTPTAAAAAGPVTGTAELTDTGVVTASAAITGQEEITGAASLLATPSPAAGAAITGVGATTATVTVTDITATDTGAVTGTTATTGVTTITGAAPISPVAILTSTAAAGQTIMDVLAGRDDLSTIAGALTAGGLAEALTEPGPFTFFAPTNAAFERAGADEIEALLNNIPRLARTLQYHVVADRVTAEDLARLGSALTTMGQSIDITVDESGQVFANGAPLRESIETDNGIIHLVDGILIPAAE